MAAILLFSLPAFSQHRLTEKNNLMRPGDEIIKQQVDYKDPGRSGENVLWDFSKLKTVNPEYKLRYVLPRARRDSTYIVGMDTFRIKNIRKNELVTGREHQTNYYYHFKDSLLCILGYENSTTLMHHNSPLPVMQFPMKYETKITTDYSSECLYSQSVLMSTHGKIQVEADAFGKMILPSKDTLNNVLRIHSVQTIFSDSIPSMDSIRIDTRIETYKWYSKGYRYPVFETIRTVHRLDSIKDVFTTAFFYPPQEHYYLEDDPENLVELEEDNQKNNPDSPDYNPWEGLTYNLYPSPVRTTLNIEMDLPKPAVVKVQLTNRQGLIMVTEEWGRQSSGILDKQLYVGLLPTGEYVLNIWLDEYRVSEKILKR